MGFFPKIYYEPNILTVSFTLLDKTPSYGPVNPVPKELSLDEVRQMLKKTIDSGQFVVPFVVSETEVGLSGFLCLYSMMQTVLSRRFTT
jgi:hypothetical protein